MYQQHGEVHIQVRMDDGEGNMVNKLVQTLGPQDFFGERSLLENVLTTGKL